MGFRLTGVAALLALTACASTGSAPVDVTRFWNQPPPRQASVTLVPMPGIDSASLEYRAYADAVAAAMARSGFRVATEQGADLTAAIGYETAVAQPVRRRSPVSVGGAASTGSYGSGFGLGIGIDLSGPPKPVVASRLTIRLSRAGDVSPLWEARAETAAKQGTAAAQPAAVSRRLADAVFRDFPGKPGSTISVR